MSQQSKLNMNQMASETSVFSGVQSWGKSRNAKKNLSAGVTLTSLVDVFTILVVYLLVTTSIGINEVKTLNGIQLPTVNQSDATQIGASIFVKNGKYYYNDKAITIDRLISELISARKTVAAVIIQADKNAKYADLNPLVLAGLQAGFTQISFAVLQEDQI